MRLDLTSEKIYVIDPPNCQDADDAFTIVGDYLWVFIADPTNEFSVGDEISANFNASQYNLIIFNIIICRVSFYFNSN